MDWLRVWNVLWPVGAVAGMIFVIWLDGKKAQGRSEPTHDDDTLQYLFAGYYIEVPITITPYGNGEWRAVSEGFANEVVSPDRSMARNVLAEYIRQDLVEAQQQGLWVLERDLAARGVHFEPILANSRGR